MVHSYSPYTNTNARLVLCFVSRYHLKSHVIIRDLMRNHVGTPQLWLAYAHFAEELSMGLVKPNIKMMFPPSPSSYSVLGERSAGSSK